MMQVHWKTICRRGNNHFDVHFRRIKSVLFPPKNRKEATYEVGNGQRGVYFSLEWAILFSCIIANNTFLTFYLDLACDQICFPPSKRNESAKTEPFLY